MATLQISLPEPLKRFVDDLVARGEFASVDEFVQEAALAHQRAMEDEAQAERMLREVARTKGRIDDEDVERVWEEIRQQRLTGLRDQVHEGLEELERGEYVTYGSADELYQDIVELADTLRHEGE